LRICAERVGNGAALARKTGIPRRTLETYLSGSAEPKASRLAEIAQAAEVSGHWLLTGEGHPGSEGEDAVIAFSTVSRPAMGDVSDRAVTAEAGKTASPNGRVDFQRRWIEAQGWRVPDLRLVEARGDCMMPTVRDGALLLVDTSVQGLREEGIYVLDVGGVLVVRRIQFDVEGGVIATGDNPAYREQYLRRNADEKLVIFGKVVWVGNTLE